LKVGIARIGESGSDFSARLCEFHQSVAVDFELDLVELMSDELVADRLDVDAHLVFSKF
jgi:hypothetical protein